MRALLALLVAGGFAEGLVAGDAPPADRLKHLRQAVEQLEAAGEDELAEPVRQALLQAESEPTRFMVQVTALEIDRARLAVDHPELAAALYLEPSAIPSVRSDRILLEQLKKLGQAGGPVKVVAEPSLAATAGKLAAYRQGGEIEIPVPGGASGDSEARRIFWRDRVEVTIDRRSGHYEADLNISIARRDIANAVTVDGKEVLGAMSFSMPVKCQLRETQLLTRLIPGYRLSSAGKEYTVLAVFLEIDCVHEAPPLANRILDVLYDAGIVR